MRDVRASVTPALRIVDDLHGPAVAAVVYGPHGPGYSLLRLNRTLLAAVDLDHVLSWARCEIARGVRVSWLLADELADLV